MITYPSHISVLFLLLFFGPGCHEKTIVTVAISGIGPKVTKLRVYSWLDQQLADERYRETSSGLPQLPIQIPAEKNPRNLDLLILGLDTSNAMLSHGYSTNMIQNHYATNILIGLSEASIITPKKDASLEHSTAMENEILGIKLADKYIYWRLRKHSVERSLDNYDWKVWDDRTIRLTAIDSIGANYAIVAGVVDDREEAVLLECEGLKCSHRPIMPNGTINSIAVMDRHNSWMVGESGSIYRCDESNCIKKESRTEARLNSAMFDGSNTMYAVGEQGKALRCDDNSCSLLDVGTILGRAARGKHRHQFDRSAHGPGGAALGQRTCRGGQGEQSHQ